MAIEGTIEATAKPRHDEDILRLCEHVRQTSFSIHRFFRHGHLEKIYENALAHRLSTIGVPVKQQARLQVYDEDGTELGDFFADLLIDDRLVLEIEACDALCDAHTAQVLGYLRASRIEHAMLINFGSPVIQFKKFILPRLT